MCKQLKEKMSQTFMSSMKSVIDTLDEHSKSIKKLEQRIKQLSAKDGGAERNKNIEFTVESPSFEDLGYYNAEDGEYCKFLDTEHPDAYIVAILKKSYKTEEMVTCYAFWVHEQSGNDLLYMADETLSEDYSHYSRGFCNLISKYTSFRLKEAYKRVDLTEGDVKQINDYIKRVGYTADFKGVKVGTSLGHFVSARLTRPLFKTPKRRHDKQKMNNI